MKILVISSSFPFGSDGTFFQAELDAISALGHPVRVSPIRPRGSLAPEGARFVGAGSRGLVDGRILLVALQIVLSRPRAVGRSLRRIFRSRSPRILTRNLVALPKALWIARTALDLRPDHIHAQWATVAATVAMVVGEVTGVPWSFSAHRWDIEEDNLLTIKCQEALFARFVSERSRELAASHLGHGPNRGHVIHLGVEIPTDVGPPASIANPPVILCPARLIELKGHRHLIHALAEMHAQGCPARLELAGSGPLFGQLEAQARGAGLGDSVSLLGHVDHDRLLARLAGHRVDVVVLASAVEGVPVALMEAMARFVPVVGTDVGGIPELLGGLPGTMVPFGDPHALAEALLRIVTDPDRARELAVTGHDVVSARFRAADSARQLVALAATETNV